jgi:hypothetical protein
MPTIPGHIPEQPWANHVIRGLKNPKFFERKVGDLSVDELQAIKLQWLPKVRAVWDTVKQTQKEDAEAFEAALAYFKRNHSAREEVRHRAAQGSGDELSAIPLDTAAALKRASPYYGPVIPDLVKAKQTRRSGQPYNPDENGYKNGWDWDCGSGECRWELDLCGMIDPDLVDSIGYVSLQPMEEGRCTLAFRIASSEWPSGVDEPEDLTFPSVESAKNYLDSSLAVSTPPLPKPLNISELPRLQEWYPNGDWQWCDYPGWEIALHTKGGLDTEAWGYIIPYRDGGPLHSLGEPKDWHDEWMIQFIGGCALYNFALFRGTLGEAKRCVDTLLGSDTPR